MNPLFITIVRLGLARTVRRKLVLQFKISGGKVTGLLHTIDITRSGACFFAPAVFLYRCDALRAGDNAGWIRYLWMIGAAVLLLHFNAAVER